MKTMIDNVIYLSTRLQQANVAAPETGIAPADDPTLHDAISVLQSLWTDTDAMAKSSRDALYDFLGVTYEFSKRLSLDGPIVQALRSLVRDLYTNKSKKKAVSDKSVVELLLAASMGLSQAGLRSKYKRILENATGVDPDRESFKVWLRDSGGIVKALSVTVAAVACTSPSSSASTGETEQSDSSVAGDLIARCTSPDWKSPRAGGHYLGFKVGLFYTDYGNGKTMQVAVISQKSIVRSAMRMAAKDAESATPATSKLAA
jgi:hypothetical protein